MTKVRRKMGTTKRRFSLIRDIFLTKQGSTSKYVGLLRIVGVPLQKSAVRASIMGNNFDIWVTGYMSYSLMIKVMGKNETTKDRGNLC